MSVGDGPQLSLANPRGFCAGVERAIEIVDRALERFGAPVYVLHEIVHNKRVLSDLSARGARFVESLADVPAGAVAIFSAHGVSSAVVEDAKQRGLRTIDATCPLVTKVHVQARQYHDAGREVVLVGHEGHPEVEGTRGRVPGPVHVLSTVEDVERLAVRDPERVAYVTQTTLSVDDTRPVIEALNRRFPGIAGPALKDICYATQNRQDAVREMTQDLDVLLVVGSHNSSNSNRLRDMGERAGCASYLIDSAEDVEPAWLDGAARIGLTAGASAPEIVVQEVVRRLRQLGATNVVELPGKDENIPVRLPDELAPGSVERV